MRLADLDLERLTRYVITAVLAMGTVTGVVIRALVLGQPGSEVLVPWPWGLAVVVGMWVAWWRVSLVEGARPLTAVVFAVFAFATVVADGTGSTQQIPEAAVVVLVLALGARWAAVVTAGLLTLMSVSLVGLFQMTWLGVAQQWFSAVVLVLFAFLLAVALDHARRAQRRTADLLHQVATRSRQVRELSLLQERSRTAGELHDGLGHQLTAIAMGLRVVEQAQGSDPARARAELERTSALAAGALQDLRRWVRALGRFHPDRHRGVDAVQSIADTFAGTTLDVEVSTSDDPWQLDDECEVVLYRIVQESLTNVVRHARAEHVTITLAAETDRIRIVVTDDGSTTAASTDKGYGLATLSDRVSEVGGTFAAGSLTGGGFRVTATLPAEVGRVTEPAVDHVGVG
ncbi:sensor histidine kinase [Propionibacteriaceae bacterium Y2011]|uniref:sensor histidine kinase n=1 Tax=Microlunatus sp. Y2014 TaxID=3418488 RepID=UPI003B4FE7AD